MSDLEEILKQQGWEQEDWAIYTKLFDAWRVNSYGKYSYFEREYAQGKTAIPKRLFIQYKLDLSKRRAYFRLAESATKLPEQPWTEDDFGNVTEAIKSNSLFEQAEPFEPLLVYIFGRFYVLSKNYSNALISAHAGDFVVDAGDVYIVYNRMFYSLKEVIENEVV